jgi:ring-1,2-phenylacetyl-CoA epoxidase subunit PaaE
MSVGFHKLRIAEVRRETPDAVSILLDVPKGAESLFKFRAGQHLTVRADFAGEEVRRNYSVCVAPHEGELRIAVKQIAGGVFSTWANGTLQAGHELDVMPPHGSFTWEFDAAAKRSYVAFAGGSGITPILSLLRTGLSLEPNSRFTLFYGNRNTPQIIFLEQLAALKNRYMDRFELFHFLEDEEEEIALFNGRLDAAKINDLLTSLVDPAKVDAFFICGPGPMMDAADEQLRARGVPTDRILIERFTTGAPSASQAAAAAALAAKASGARISIGLDGRRTNIAFDAAKGSILESARAAGLPTPYACKAGVCATCRAKVISGTVEMKTNYGLSPAEVAQGYVLTCQAVPTSDTVVIDYEG